MLQEVGLPPSVRVGELARCTADLYPAAVDIALLMERLDLHRLERRTIRQLSGGEQRRLAMALALVGRPQVVFLDEPTAGVDADGREVIRQIIGELRDDGVAVLLTTHDLGEAERVADRFVVIDSGQLRAEGTLDELRSHGATGPEIRFRAPSGLDTLSLAHHLGGWHEAPVTEVSWGEYRVAAHPTPAMIAALTSWLDYYGLPLTDLRTGHQTLEDLFLELTSPDAPPPELLDPRDPRAADGFVAAGYPVAADHAIGGAGTADPRTTGGHPTVPGRRWATGEQPVVPTTAPWPTGEQPVVPDRPWATGEQPIVPGRRPFTGRQPVVGRHPISGEYRVIPDPPPLRRPVEPRATGPQPIVHDRPWTGEHPILPTEPEVPQRPASGPGAVSPRDRYPNVTFRD
jgi:ABC-2 type transport system ATP-binding protein